MKFFSFSAIVGTLSLAALGLAGCTKDEAVPAATGEFTMEMNNGVTMTSAAGVTSFTPLVLDATTYKNPHGDDFTVSTFKYYISNVKLTKGDGSTYAVPNSYFLVDQSKPDSRELKMTEVPIDDYTGLTFTLGVDSARTKAGNLTGVLDGNNGMLWTMNGPEFINLKLEGRSPQSPTSALTFHLAGYQHSTTNTIRTVTLPFPSTKLLVRADHSPEIHMQCDLAKLFDGPNPTTTGAPFQNPVNFASVYNAMSGKPVAKLADNAAAGMFSVAHIHAN